jgi:hypothetical protein
VNDYIDLRYDSDDAHQSPPVDSVDWTHEDRTHEILRNFDWSKVVVGPPEDLDEFDLLGNYIHDRMENKRPGRWFPESEVPLTPEEWQERNAIFDRASNSNDPSDLFYALSEDIPMVEGNRTLYHLIKD